MLLSLIEVALLDMIFPILASFSKAGFLLGGKIVGESSPTTVAKGRQVVVLCDRVAIDQGNRVQRDFGGFGRFHISIFREGGQCQPKESSNNLQNCRTTPIMIDRGLLRIVALEWTFSA